MYLLFLLNIFEMSEEKLLKCWKLYTYKSDWRLMFVSTHTPTQKCWYCSFYLCNSIHSSWTSTSSRSCAKKTWSSWTTTSWILCYSAGVTFLFLSLCQPPFIKCEGVCHDKEDFDYRKATKLLMGSIRGSIITSLSVTDLSVTERQTVKY